MNQRARRAVTGLLPVIAILLFWTSQAAWGRRADDGTRYKRLRSHYRLDGRDLFAATQRSPCHPTFLPVNRLTFRPTVLSRSLLIAARELHRHRAANALTAAG